MSSTPYLKRPSSEEKYSRPFSPQPGRAASAYTAASLRMRPVYALLVVGFFTLLAVPFAHSRPRALVRSSLSEYYATPAFVTQAPAPSGGIPEEFSVPLTLDARLSHLLNRPALQHSDATLANRHGCPYQTYFRDEYWFHRGKGPQWESIGPEEIHRYRNILVEHLRELERSGQKVVFEEGMDSHIPKHLRRGIIMSAGEAGLGRVMLSLRMLREVLHSDIPIEIYHFDDELQDERMLEEIVAEFGNIIFVKVEGRNTRTQKSWNIKNIAFVSTNFTEFMWLDSDNFPLVDPAEIFEGVEYKQSGSAFWPDLYKDHPDNAIWRILGRDCSDQHWPAEAGQMVFDKRGNNGLNLAVLHIANHMMARDDLYDYLSYGDKDTFRYSFYALGLPYQQAPRMWAPTGGFQDSWGKDGDFCAHSMMHWALTPPAAAHDPDYHPKPAFLHANLAKYRTGLQHRKLFSHIRHPRLDRINEPKLVRTLYTLGEHCFHVDLQGPDGLASNNSAYDGQGVLTTPFDDLLPDDVWSELSEIARQYIEIHG